MTVALLCLTVALLRFLGQHILPTFARYTPIHHHVVHETAAASSTAGAIIRVTVPTGSRAHGAANIAHFHHLHKQTNNK